MTPKIDPQELLLIWEKIWGKISSDWAVKFLTDSRVKEILTFPDSSIKIAIINHNKLDEIISYLKKYSPTLETSPKQDKGMINQRK